VLRFTNNNIRILVGDPDAPKEYLIYAFQIVDRSRFFRNALSHDWKEATERTIKFPEGDPETFERYLSMVLTDTIAIGEELDKDSEHQREHVQDEVRRRYLQLVELFVLCDKLQDTEGMNSVIDALLEQLDTGYLIVKNVAGHTQSDANSSSPSDLEHRKRRRTYVAPTYRVINLIYSNTAGPRSIRRLVLDLWTAFPGFLAKTLGKKVELNYEFLLDLAKRLAEHAYQDSKVRPCRPRDLCPKDYYEDEHVSQAAEESGSAKKTKTT
tara:strand:+ start:2185 stop:2988 length:804 start_codon:yes stop_codon:yes gene_type:complete